MAWTVGNSKKRIELMLTEQNSDDKNRQSILTVIRKNLAASAPFDAARPPNRPDHGVSHRINSAKELEKEAAVSLTERFLRTLETVEGCCVVVADEEQAAKAVQQIAGEKRARRIAISDSSLVRRIVQRMSGDIEFLEAASREDLFSCDAGMTSAQWVIAESGTLVLESEKERNRLESLVPPLHIAIIEASQIRQTMAEALQSISQGGPDKLSRAVTFITGPSRTSDIELTLAIGVHGPRELHVVIIDRNARRPA